MIDSISSSSSFLQSSSTSNRRNEDVLSFDQQLTIESVLSNYDSDNLSAQDASEIVSAFQDAGIKPSKSLADAMDSMGFDAQMVGELAGVQAQGGMPPPPPPPPKGDENAIADILSELLDSDDDDDDNSNSNTSTNAYSSGADTSFESVLDYTSRILSLNDDAKEKVMDLFEAYKPENTDLSKEDAGNIIKNSLQNILSDENNYTSTSFYA